VTNGYKTRKVAAQARLLALGFVALESCVSLAQLSEALRDDTCIRSTRLRALAHERKNRCGKGRSEQSSLESADVRKFESSARLSGKVVVAARLHSEQPLAKARKRQCVVAHCADVVFGLPDTPTLDARAPVERVDDAPPEDG
jgi:hypothetical protein